MYSIKYFTTLLLLSPAFAAYSTLRRYHNPPAHLLPLPLSSLLLCCSSTRALPQGLQIHSHLLSLGLLTNSPLLAKLVTLYAACDLLPKALSLLDASPSRCPLPWNALLSGYVRGGLFAQAIDVYKKKMVKSRGVRGDAFTYPSVLKACGEIGELGFGRKVREDLERDGLLSNLFVGNALLSMYARCGDMDAAREVFDEMPQRDRVSWNAVISAYAAKGMWPEAMEMFCRRRRLVEVMGVDVVTWNTVAGGYLQMGDFREALRLVVEAKCGGEVLDHVTFVVGLRACSQIGCIKLGKEIHGMMIRLGFEEVETVRNALITMYSRCKNTRSAYILFRRPQVRSLVTWNCMITGYCNLDQAQQALSLLQEMVKSEMQPNFVTIVTILSLCARSADLHHGKELHCHIIRQGFNEPRLLWNALVDMYSKSGRVVEARRVFESMTDRDQVSYTSLIAGYGMQGEGLVAIELFDEMILRGFRPDGVSMVAVLSACGHAGLVSQGQKLFDNMVAGEYGFEPLAEHYSCMVDLFARAGLLEKADEFLNAMPIKPSAAMWASLVAACHVYRNADIGEKAATRLLNLATDNPGHYVLIANMYAVAGNWGMLSKVRTLMRDMHLHKMPGCAWVDTGNGVHPFLVEDRHTAHCTEIYTLMDVLTQHLRDDGYVGGGCVMELDCVGDW